MSKEISLFSDYHTKENSLTNHCGLILKLLYEENPKSFEELISSLTSTNFIINPVFEQQVKKESSVPDLVIEQKSFSIFFETKRYDWFHENQIVRHLEGFKKNVDYNILFLLSNFENDNLEEKFQEHIKLANSLDIILVPISFEELVDTLESVESSDIFKKFLSEFRNYLDRNNYFPSWKYLFEIVNCASTIHEVHEQNVFMCPNTGGIYSHKKAKYFGGYKWKNVKFIHEIKAVVVVEKNYENIYIQWNNTNEQESELIEEAKYKISLWSNRIEEIKNNGLQVFLLDNPHEVNFRKTSKGGLYGNKKYFWDLAKELNANNSKELAEGIMRKNLTWK
jgi:hypothetical protein